MKAIFFLVMSLLLASAATAADVEGFWTGFAIRGGERRPISLHVERNDGDFSARYDIRSLSLEGMPLAKFVYDPATGVIGAGHAFKGRVSGDRITGELNPALLHGPPVKVELRRSSARLPSLAAHERVKLSGPELKLELQDLAL